MSLLEGEDQRAVEALGALAWGNPFAPEREALVARALGPAYRAPGGGAEAASANDRTLADRAALLVPRAGAALAGAPRADAAARSSYADLVRFLLVCRLADLFRALADACASGALSRRRVSSYRLLREEMARLGAVREGALAEGSALDHQFAVLFQTSRAAHAIAHGIVGRSEAARGLRAAAWESIFGRDLRRYERVLHARMREVPTLVSGARGGGQREVAEIVASTTYLPFDGEAMRFTAESEGAELALDAHACRPREAEARLFGRRASGDAVQVGLFARCPEHATVIVGHVDALARRTQARLASALGARAFLPDGGDDPVPFRGKLVATTEADLGAAARDGRASPTLALALRVDVLEVPSLRARIQNDPSDLEALVRRSFTRMLGVDHVDGTVDEALAFLDAHRRGHDWPGGLDELEATLRSLLVRGGPTPPPDLPVPALDRLASGFRRAELEAERLLDAYCTIAYVRWGSYQEAARRLGLDRRTVRARVDDALADAIKREDA